MEIIKKAILNITLTTVICSLTILNSPAQQLTVSTFAGTGTNGFTDGDALTQAEFSFPIGVGVCVGTNGVVYVADKQNNAIRKIEDGIVTTLAGDGTAGFMDGTGANARFNAPTAITIDANNNIYVAEFVNCLIRKITPSGIVTTIAGIPGFCGFQNGPSATAKFFGLLGIAIDSIGNLYVSDIGNSVIRKIDTSGTVSTYAGIKGSPGHTDGPAATARFRRPTGLAFDSNGNLFVAEEGNHTVRMISTSLIVTTIAGIGTSGFTDGDALTQAEFNTPSDLTVDLAGNIYVADRFNHRIRKIASGNVTTIAGIGTPGFTNGDALTQAQFKQPHSICHDDSNKLFVADIINHRIRLISGLAPPAPPPPPPPPVGFTLNGPLLDSLPVAETPPMVVFDRFGNEKLLEEIAITQNSHVAGIFRLHFQDVEDGDLATDDGFDDQNAPVFANNCSPPCATLGEERQAVLIQVCEDLTELLGGLANFPDPYPDESSLCLDHNDPFPDCRKVEIEVQISNQSPGTASASQWYLDIGTGISYGNIWEYINTGYDPYYNLANPPFLPAPSYHGRVAVNFTGVTLYTDLNTPTPVPPPGQGDMYTILLHEMIHALGFASLIASDGTSRITGTGISPVAGRYGTWDAFLQTMGGTPLLDFDLDLDCYDAFFNTATSGDLAGGCPLSRFVGPLGNPTNIVTTLGSFDESVSLSHFNCTTLPDYIMNAILFTGPHLRFPKIEEVLALCALGYNIQGTYGNNDFGLSTHTYAGTTCPNPRIVAGTNDFRPWNSANDPLIDPDFTVEAGLSITLGFNDILQNDNNAATMQCLDFVYGGGDMSNVTNITSTGFTYTPPSTFSGVTVFKYRPQNADSPPERGNITYIFITVTAAPLACTAPPTSCNLVCHGDFESVINGFAKPLSDFGFTTLFINANTPDLFVNSVHQTFGWNTLPSLWRCDTPPSAVPAPQGPTKHIGLSAANDIILGFVTEGVFFELNNTMSPNRTYNITFWAYAAEDSPTDPDCLLPVLNVLGSTNRPCERPIPIGLPPAPNPCGAGFDPETVGAITVSTSAWVQYSIMGWQPTFEYNFIMIYAEPPATKKTYVYLDDVEIVEVDATPLSITPTVSNSTPCSGDDFTITYNVCNLTGSANAADIILQANLPPGITINTGGDFDDITGQATIGLGSLAGGVCVDLILDLNVGPGAVTGTPIPIELVASEGACVPGSISIISNITVNPLPIATIISTGNESCTGANDGFIDLDVSDGTAPYNFNWTGPGSPPSTEDLINLASGSYNVVVTDVNGCTASTGATITAPAPCPACFGFISLHGSSVIQIPPCGPGLWIASPCPGSNYGYILFISKPPNTATWEVGTTITIQLDFMEFLNTEYSTCDFTTNALPGDINVTYTLNSPISGSAFCMIGMTTQNVTTAPGNIWNTNATLNLTCSFTSATINTSLSEGPTTCSCDPNDKQVAPAGCGDLGFITNQELTYHIRFQNVGLGPAFDVVLRDTIDDDLDLNSLQILASSHTITNTQVNQADRELVITFQGINLPAEKDDSVGSQGMVIYSMTPNQALPEGTTIVNSTGIFFNGNVPVITNTVINTIVNDPVLSVDAGDDQTVFLGFPPEECADLTATATDALPPYSFEWSTGDTTQDITVCPSVTTDFTVIADASRCLSEEDTITVNVEDVRCGDNLNKVLICHIPPGNPNNPQTLCISPNAVPAHLANHGGDFLGPCTDTTQIDSLNFQVQFSQVLLTSHPNPLSQSTIITFLLPEPSMVTLTVPYLNSLEVVKLFEGYAEANTFYTVEFDAENFADGVYFCRLITDTGIYTKKLVIIK